jgi:hypothetical protein
MCVDCVLASLKIAQADPGRRTPPRGGSVIIDDVVVVVLGGGGGLTSFYIQGGKGYNESPRVRYNCSPSGTLSLVFPNYKI